MEPRQLLERGIATLRDAILVLAEIAAALDLRARVRPQLEALDRAVDELDAILDEI